MRTETEIIEHELFNQRLMARLSVAFGLLALLLTSLGVYGVLAYSVARRTSEIAIRMSLGAMPGRVMNLIIRQGLWPMLIGSSIGLAAAAALTRLVAKFLYGVKPLDPVTFFGGAVLLVGSALLACYIPARRAMRVDPMVALRHE
jgi:ABC-type antimicrobial peptide transport system permease subunit